VFGALSFAASMVPTLLIMPFAGVLTFVIVPPLGVIVGFVVFEGRQRKGLQLRRYEAYLDKRKVDPDTFFVCFQPVTTGLGFNRIVNSTEPAFQPLENAPAVVFTPSRRPIGKRKPA
jgi:hypothetical protein